MVAEQSLRIDSENVKATAEQMQEALQQQQHELQVLGARIAALETQLHFESARAQEAEQERSTLIQSLGAMRPNRGDAMVDTKGIGQPFTLKGGADHDFGEWTHKVRTFMLARFGDEILTAPTRAARQQRIVDKTCVASQRNRFVPWITVFGETAAEDEIDNIEMTSSENFMPTLYLLQPTQPTGSFGTSEKEMAWKPGDDCTASTTRHRP